MDQETIRPVIAALPVLLGALIGVIGGALTAAINQIGAREAQRALARDLAVRQARWDAARLILEFVDHRSNRFFDALRGMRAGDADEAHRIRSELEAQRATSLSCRAISHTAFVDALDRLDPIDQNIMRSLELDSENSTLALTCEDYRNGVVELHRAAEPFWSQLTKSDSTILCSG